MSPSGAKAISKRRTKTPAVSSPQEEPVPSARDIYLPEYAEIARRERSRGATDAELCDALGISAAALAIWQQQNAEFAGACVVDEGARIKRLEDRLYEQALGRTTSEQTIVEVNGRRKVTIVKKEVPPDMNALKFLMTNMDPKNWRLKPEPPVEEEKEDPFRVLLRQIAEDRRCRIGPVAMHPGEEKHIAEYYLGEIPEWAKGWKRNPLYNPELGRGKEEESSKE